MLDLSPHLFSLSPSYAKIEVKLSVVKYAWLYSILVDLHILSIPLTPAPHKHMHILQLPPIQQHSIPTVNSYKLLCKYAYVYLYLYVYIYVCIFVYMYVYIMPERHLSFLHTFAPKCQIHLILYGNGMFEHFSVLYECVSKYCLQILLISKSIVNSVT